MLNSLLDTPGPARHCVAVGLPAESPSQLPNELASRLNGQLEGQTIVTWSSFDLDDSNNYADRFAVLTEQALHVVAGTSARSIALTTIKEATIAEGLGVDRIVLIGGDGGLMADLHYTRRHRRGMTRLHRMLQRRLPRPAAAVERDKDQQAADSSADLADLHWLERVEQQAEKNEHCGKCGQMIPSYAEGVCPACLHNKKILWRLLGVARPYRARIWWSLGLTLIVAGMAPLSGLLNRHIIDSTILNTALVADIRIQRMIVWLTAWLGLVVVSEFLTGWRLKILSTVGTQVTGDLRHLVYAHLQELSLRYFSKRRTGSLITRVTSDTDRLWDFMVFGSVNLIRDVAMIVAMAVAMFYMNATLAVVSLAPLPLLGLITYTRGVRMQKMFGRLWTYWSRLTAVVGDALPGVRVIKAFANEHREVRRFDARSEEYTAKEQEIHRVWTTFSASVSGLMQIGRLLVLGVGGYLVIRHPGGPNTIGTLIAFIGFVWMFYQPIMELANSNRMVTRAATSAQRIFEVLDTPPEVYSRTGAARKERLDGRVEFRGVSFSYEGNQPALRDVSILAEPGEMVGLCGPSGAGKSTFVNLICRFFDPTDGQILIDGLDLRDYDIKWLRRQIGMVLQEPYLFHGTIADNIRYGNPDATIPEVINAARAANAHDFIVGFPDGYDTLVGERGQSLSGGERQRVSIARAILHNPRILILDEATSSVDSQTEKQIQEALDRLVEGRTTFAIAHRLSTLQAADRLIVLDKGKVVEQGTHEALVNKADGVYAKLHKTQMEMNQVIAIAAGPTK